MLRGWRIGTVAGIAIEINSSWLIIFGIFLASLGSGHFPEGFPQARAWQHWTAALAATILLFVSVLVHEVSHSLIARRYGLGVSRITLFIFGGVAQSEGEPKTALSELWIAIIGPLTSVAVSGVSYGIGWAIGQASAAPIWAGVFQFNGMLNLWLAGFNMVPAFPLDGGRVLRACIWYLTDDLLNSTRIATILGKAFGYLLMGLGLFMLLVTGNIFGLYTLGLGWLLTVVAANAFQSVRLQVMLQGVTVGHLMRPARVLVDATWPVQYVVDNYFAPYRLTALPVVHGHEVVGILRLDSVRGVDPGNWPYLPVHQIMNSLDPEADFISIGASAIEALQLMMRKQKDYLLVTDAEGLAGTVSEADVAAAVEGL